MHATIYTHRQTIGKVGEDYAEAFLLSKGMVVQARNIRMQQGEIDYIAQDGPTLVFGEVKTRTDSPFNDPYSTITRQKLRRLQRLALLYAKNTKNYRCDLIRITLSPTNGLQNLIYEKDIFL